MSAYYVTMTDKFMSGWGMASNKINKLVIECDTYSQANAILRAAKDRSEMKNVNLCSAKPYYNTKRYLTSLKHFSDLGGCWLEYYQE